MRWLWYEWKEESKPWVGLGNPCTPHDKELFSAATKVTIGSGKKAIFWDSSWLNGLRPRDVAPLIFDISKKKKITVAKALLDDFWITQINMQDGISIQHIVQFTNLWEMLQDVDLDPNSPDTIAWKLTNNKEYSAKSAYTMQFLGHTSSLMPTLVWKPWAPPKCKIFAWLILQNRVWTADRLEKRGWQNCGLCKLCNQVHESGAHLLFKCRFTIRIWRSLKEWLGLSDLEPREWNNITSVKEWWNIAINKKGEDRRGLASLAMLVSWEVWNERNGRVFRNKFSTANMVILKIKEEANCWSLAGAKALGSLMMRE
jgi:hypothetical protein